MTKAEITRAVCGDAVLAGAMVLLAGCSPEVGSDAWCESMDAKSKADWSANDVADYTKHCVLDLKPDKQ